jgi:hypothetical protein
VRVFNLDFLHAPPSSLLVSTACQVFAFISL